MNNNKYNKTIEGLKSLPIDGCITGSCLIDCDKSDGDEIPDIDIFCYSLGSWVDAISLLTYKHNCAYGTVEADGADTQQEIGKKDNTMKKGIGKIGLSTVKLNKDGININLTVHKDKQKALDVISAFDMTLICRAYDIPTGHYMDYSGVGYKEYMEMQYTRDMFAVITKNEVAPNPHKVQDEYDVFTVQRWLRQGDRVVKYWNRGFNTIEVAKFYSSMLQKVLDKGNIFMSESSQEFYEEQTKDFQTIKDMIDTWIEDKQKEVNDAN